jgi:DNA-binding response OmpR family regulator
MRKVPQLFPINLTKKETDFMNLLIRNPGQVVSFDQISLALWKEKSYDKFSLNAIAKIAQRIREKLKAHDIEPNYLKTSTGKGYTLLV